MKRFAIALTLGAGMLAGAVALAGPRDCTRPMSEWQPREAVAARAIEMGIQIARIRTDDGCYKVYGTDGEGRGVEIEFDPATLEVVEYEYREFHHGPKPDETHGEHGPDGHGEDHGPHDGVVPLLPDEGDAALAPDADDELTLPTEN